MDGIGAFNPVTSLMSGLTSFAGGMFQAAELRKQTAIQLEQMRRQAAQHLGVATAQAASSGVEMTSGTVQNHLQVMRDEWQKRIQQVQSAGSDAQTYAMLNGAGSMFSSFAQNLSKSSQITEALGSDPNAFMDEGAKKLNNTLSWNWGP